MNFPVAFTSLSGVIRYLLFRILSSSADSLVAWFLHTFFLSNPEEKYMGI